MKMKVVRWQNIVDEVRYWDAMDLLRNLDEELENARRGFASCVFRQGASYPYVGEDKILLHPEVKKKKDHIEIDFPNLKNVRKEDIDVEIEGGRLSVNVKMAKRDKKEIFGWFRMDIPDDMDAETCKAEHKQDSLRICIKNRTTRPSKRKIALG